MENETKQKKKIKKKTLIITLSSILAGLCFTIFFWVPHVGVIFFYNQIYGSRIKTPTYEQYKLESYENLERKSYDFKNSDNQKIQGYKYFCNGVQEKGLVVVSHGFGYGHNYYLSCINSFVQRGYTCFAFDQTGVDESEGNNTKSMTQMVLDLESALKFVDTVPEMKNLNKYLFGHSQGGYAVNSVLKFYPNVKAVAALSPFNKYSDIISFNGSKVIGGLANALVPYFNMHENYMFKNYAGVTAVDGLKSATKVGMFCAQSEDDANIPYQIGLESIKNEMGNDSRCEFVTYKNRGHMGIFKSDEIIAYYKEIDEKFEAAFKDKVPTEDEIVSWKKANIDEKKYANYSDNDLFNKIDTFFQKF